MVLHDNDTETSLALEAIVHRRHNPDELPEKQRPVINPELMLTSLYFLQEMRRPVSEEEKRKADLRAMDEELVANLVRGRFLSGIIVDESEKDADSKAENPDGNTEDGNIEEAKESETEEEQPKKKITSVFRMSTIRTARCIRLSSQTDTSFRGLIRRKDFVRLS